MNLCTCGHPHTEHRHTRSGEEKCHHPGCGCFEFDEDMIDPIEQQEIEDEANIHIAVRSLPPAPTITDSEKLKQQMRQDFQDIEPLTQKPWADLEALDLDDLMALMPAEFHYITEENGLAQHLIAAPWLIIYAMLIGALMAEQELRMMDQTVGLEPRVVEATRYMRLSYHAFLKKFAGTDMAKSGPVQ